MSDDVRNGQNEAEGRALESRVKADHDRSLTEWGKLPNQELERRWWSVVQGKLPQSIARHELNRVIFGETSFAVEPRLHQLLLSHGYAPDVSGGAPGYHLVAQPRKHLTAAATKSRLNALVPKAVKALQLALKAANPCDTCGMIADARHAAVVLRAAQLVLDRTGYGPKSTVEVEAPPPEWAKYLTDDQLRTVVGWISEAKAKARAEAGIVDVEAREVGHGRVAEVQDQGFGGGGDEGEGDSGDGA